jgi:hypothetical protein
LVVIFCSSFQSNGRNFSDLSWTQETLPAAQKAVKIPKELFVEMDELKGEEWQEQARSLFDNLLSMTIDPRI